MQSYEVKTPLRGFRRADGERAPIAAGEVVILPLTKATADLLDLDAIAPTDAEETCPIEHISVFGQSSGQAADALSSAPFAPIAVVAVTDRYALVAAIEDLGGVVFFVGEGLPDDAGEVLADFSNDQLIDEMSFRLANGRLSAASFSRFGSASDQVAVTARTHDEEIAQSTVEALKPVTEIALPAGAIIQPGQDGAGGAVSGGQPVPDAVPSIIAPRPVATTARKPKATAK